MSGCEKYTNNTLNDIILQGDFNGDTKQDLCTLILNDTHQPKGILFIILDIEKHNQFIDFQYWSKEWFYNDKVNVILSISKSIDNIEYINIVNIITGKKTYIVYNGKSNIFEIME